MTPQHETLYWLPDKNYDFVLPNWILAAGVAVVILLALWIVKRRKP
jgi:LPXTG-motif cell wall-anchored protein